MKGKVQEEKSPKERSTEIEWLRWFYEEADFGPADGDVRMYLKEDFVEETGKLLPEEYEDE
jgi:hypothetical protein